MLIFWGCWDRPGHYLWTPYKSTLRDFEADRQLVPRANYLDATIMFLPKDERVGTGALTYLPGIDRTILAWWGSPFDTRGKVNSALIADGQLTLDAIWHRFSQLYPDLEPKLQRPYLQHEARTT